jgi:hypothetical protein
MKLLPILLAATFTTQSFATLRVTNPDRGEKTVELAVNGRSPEICVIPKKIEGAVYTEGDKKDEVELCKMDIDKTVAACGKEESTNPGVNFFVPDAPKEIQGSAFQALILDLQKSDCTAKYNGEAPNKEAKYKLSSSCSYSPSILSYYHMSRALGDIVNVPVAVMRTMDIGRHIAIGKDSLSDTVGEGLIHDTWSSLMSQLTAGANASRKDLLFTEDFKQSYGALQKNPKKEEKYAEFFNSGADRVAAFKSNNAIYKSLTSSNLNIPREFNQQNVQKMVQLRDAADFILLDTIMGQQDRFGNIHYIKRYYYPGVGKKTNKFDVKSEKKKEKIPAELQAKAVEIKELMLKDNDCGVAKEHRIKAGKLLEGVAHMSPKTYKALMAMDKVIDQQKDYFITEFNYTSSDFKKVSDNLKEAADMLKEKCLKGTLKLDLSLDDHFSGDPLPSGSQCEG